MKSNHGGNGFPFWFAGAVERFQLISALTGNVWFSPESNYPVANVDMFSFQSPILRYNILGNEIFSTESVEQLARRWKCNDG